MKNKIIKLISAVVCTALIFTVTAVVSTVIHGAQSDDVVLFYNDRAWTLARLPVEQIHNIYYVPITFMAQLPEVEVRINQTLKTFIITHGERFLSFDMVSDFAVNHNKERMYLKTGEYHNERYVPVDTVCAYLGLGFEQITNQVTGAVALRVTDGHQTEKLEDLAKNKYPSLFSASEAADSSKDTTSQVKPPTPVVSDRTVYITVEGAPGKYTADILAVLKNYGVKATFFVVGEQMLTGGAILSQIAAGGHTIALEGMTASDTTGDKEAVLSDIEAQNELLYTLIKQKSRIRKAPESSVDSEADTALHAALRDDGYYLWQANVTIPANMRSTRAADMAIDGILKNETAVISFEQSAYTASALRTVLNFIKENSDACEIRVVSPVFWEDGAAEN